MKIKFRVIDKQTGEDLTDRICWVLRPDGKLALYEGGELNDVDERWVDVIYEINDTIGSD